MYYNLSLDLKKFYHHHHLKTVFDIDIMSWHLQHHPSCLQDDLNENIDFWFATLDWTTQIVIT